MKVNLNLKNKINNNNNISNMKRKLLWISDYGHSGYTLVTNCLLKSILTYFDVYLLVINTSESRNDILKNLSNNKLEIPEDNVFNVETVKSLSERDVNQLLGYFKLPYILNKINPDIIISINDQQILSKQLESIKKCILWDGIIIAYMPVDAENYCNKFFNPLNKFDQVITMNEISKQIMFNSGFYKHVYVLEHPIQNTFYDDKINKQIYRQKYLSNIIKNKDSIVIMNSNVNSFRKRLDLTIESFYQFNIKNREISNNVYLVMKTKLVDDYNIPELVDKFNEKYK